MFGVVVASAQMKVPFTRPPGFKVEGYALRVKVPTWGVNRKPQVRFLN